MAVTAITSDRYKYALVTKLIDLENDSIKILLMRDGFIFDKGDHRLLVNIKLNVVIDATGNTITVADAGNTFIRTSGSFLTDGFVVGGEVTTTNFTNAANNGTFLISAISALVMTVTTTAGGDPSLTDETNTTVNNLTWDLDDELATGNGYTQDTKVLASPVVTEDNVNHYTNCTFDDITWLASGGIIGPSPGAILYDDTTTENTIIGYIDFDGDESRTAGLDLDIKNIELREI
jgi:hypothetical protein